MLANIMRALLGNAQRAMFTLFALGFTAFAVFDVLELQAVKPISGNLTIISVDLRTFVPIIIAFVVVVESAEGYIARRNRLFGKEYRTYLIWSVFVVMFLEGLFFPIGDRYNLIAVAPYLMLGLICYCLALLIAVAKPSFARLRTKKWHRMRERERRRGVLL